MVPAPPLTYAFPAAITTSWLKAPGPTPESDHAARGASHVRELPDGCRLQREADPGIPRPREDLATTARYIKNLPVPWGTTERAKLEAYLATEIGG
jgi:hypothetical protein